MLAPQLPQFRNSRPSELRADTIIARRAFSQAAPEVWNDLPIGIRVSVTLDRFRSALRTHHYRFSFDIDSTS
jgi:hypothetical protein